MRCSIDECEKRARTRGWCDMHYRRWRKNGSPTAARQMGRPRTRPSYSAIHAWLKTERGPAKGYDCISCGDTAAEWSYLGGDPGEQRDSRNRLFSTNLLLYVPRCIPCHRGLDGRHKRRKVPAELHEKYAAGASIASLARESGIPAPTLWRHLKLFNERPKGVVKA